MRTFKLYSFGKFQLYSTGLYGSLKSRQESVGIVFMTMVSLGKGSAQTGTQGPSGTLEHP